MKKQIPELRHQLPWTQDCRRTYCTIAVCKSFSSLAVLKTPSSHRNQPNLSPRRMVVSGVLAGSIDTFGTERLFVVSLFIDDDRSTRPCRKRHLGSMATSFFKISAKIGKFRSFNPQLAVSQTS